MVKYSRHVGRKFHEDGSLRRFPGNTIICHIPKDSEQFSLPVEYQNLIKSQDWAEKYSFLPPDSFHMTVFEGICDQVRKPSHWFKALPLDATLEETDKFMIDVWNKIEKPDSFMMKATGIAIGSTITVRLTPLDDEWNKKIRGFRDLLAEKLTLKMPNHKIYGFHISLAYQIIKTTPLERYRIKRFAGVLSERIRNEFGVLKLNAPELTFFEDMGEFKHSR